MHNAESFNLVIISFSLSFTLSVSEGVISLLFFNTTFPHYEPVLIGLSVSSESHRVLIFLGV